MMRGINVGSGELADAVTTACFDAGLIIETSGPHGEVIKILAPLVIDDALLAQGLDILETRLREAMAERSEEHTSELQSLMRISYAVFCLKKKKLTTPLDATNTN